MQLDLNQFRDTVKEASIIYLATSKNNHVTVRPVSPLITDDSMTVYFYTSNQSEKYEQMKANPNIAFSVGSNGCYQAQGTVKFAGNVFSDENKWLKDKYKEKYAFAFEVGAPGEDMQTNEFIAIDIKLLKGWIFEGEVPVGMGEVRF